MRHEMFKVLVLSLTDFTHLSMASWLFSSSILSLASLSSKVINSLETSLMYLCQTEQCKQYKMNTHMHTLDPSLV